MILSNIVSTILQVISRPQILLPVIGFLIACEALLLVTGIMIDRPVIDLYLYADSIPNDNLIGYFLFTYPVEVIFALILSALMLVLSTVSMFSVARMAKNESLIEAINDSMLEAQKAIGLAVLIGCALVIGGFALSLISSLAQINSEIGTLFALILLVLVFVVIVKTIFVIPALVENDLKKAFKKSWQFTDKRFWKTIVYVVIAFAISASVGSLLGYAGFLLGEIPEVILTILGQAFNIAFFTAAITNYFYSKQ
jgi:hypothetical protein